MTSFRILAVLVLATLATSVVARPVLDQDVPYGMETIDVGGALNIVVAQTVTAGMTGDLMRVELGVGCAGGELILEIVSVPPGASLPGTAVRSRTAISTASIPNPPAPRTFDLARWPSISSGESFAIVLRNPTGTCTLLKGGDGDPYRSGAGFFQRASFPVAWLQFLDFGDSGDLGFKTIINAPVDSPPCIVNGAATPFPGFLPVCRCIEDAGLRDFRCALMDPSFFLFRNLPFPIRAGSKFEMKWTLVIFAPMEGVLEVTDHLPAGFGGVPKGPLTFFVGQVPVGESITLSYPAVAPLKPGKYKVETSVGDMQMRTTIEVVP